MNTENKNPFDILVRFVQYVMDVLARAVVAFLDGLNEAVEHSSSPLFGVVATFLPFALPIPVAFMTAHSAQKFFAWEAWQANILGLGIEGLGLLVWVWLVECFISEDETLRAAIRLPAAVAVAYELTLIILNVVLAWSEGAGFLYGFGLLLICLLPAMSAAMYGFQRRQVRNVLAAKEADRKAEAERTRQERREERREARELKLKYAKDAEEAKLKPFRDSKRK